jgi:5'-deoxynucleotidase YfbR-like HD superfamily hydrolase
MISPFKALLGESYKSIEARLQEAIHIRFELATVTPVRLKKLIKKADHISAWFEAVQLAGFSEAESNKLFGEPPEGIRLKLKPLSVPAAQEAFLARYGQLHNDFEMSKRR